MNLILGGTGRLGNVLSKSFVGEFVGSEWDLSQVRRARQCFDHYKPDCVIHLACKSPTHSDKDLYPFFYDNAKVNINVINECIQRGIRLIVCSSSLAYSSATNPSTEEDLYVGLPDRFMPYGMSKRLAHMHLVSCPEYTKWTILYLPNLYGPHDNLLNDHYFIPSLIRKMISEDHVEIHNSKTKRQFLYMEDLSRIFKIVLDREIFGSFNVAPPQSWSLEDVAKMLCNLLNCKKSISYKAGDQSHIMNTDKFKAEFNNFEFTFFQDGLKHTAHHMTRDKV